MIRSAIAMNRSNIGPQLLELIATDILIDFVNNSDT